MSHVGKQIKAIIVHECMHEASHNSIFSDGYSLKASWVGLVHKSNVVWFLKPLTFLLAYISMCTESLAHAKQSHNLFQVVQQMTFLFNKRPSSDTSLAIAISSYS